MIYVLNTDKVVEIGTQTSSSIPPSPNPTGTHDVSVPTPINPPSHLLETYHLCCLSPLFYQALQIQMYISSLLSSSFHFRLIIRTLCKVKFRFPLSPLDDKKFLFKTFYFFFLLFTSFTASNT